MNKELIIFGPNGNLGKVVTEILLNKEYNKYYIFGRENPRTKFKDNVYYFEIDDLTFEENVQKAFYNIEPDKNTAYFLVSTIGGYINTGGIQDIKVDELYYMINKNFLISFLISKYFLRLMENSQGGSICFISASSSLRPIKRDFAYNISKRALNNLIEYMSEEGKKYNFSINGIAPNTLEYGNDRLGNRNKPGVVSLSETGELIQSIFERYKSLSGNIFNLPGDLDNLVN